MQMITESPPAPVQIDLIADLDGDHRLTLTSAILPSFSSTITLGEAEELQFASQLRGDHSSFASYRDIHGIPLDHNGWSLFTMSELGPHVYLTICDDEGREMTARLTHAEAHYLADALHQPAEITN